MCEAFAKSAFAFDHYDIIPYKKNVSVNENAPEEESNETASSYERREVTFNDLDGSFHEPVFVCPTWNHKEERIVNFHISAEQGDERFRFVFDEQKGKQLVGMAVVEIAPETPAFVDISRIEELKKQLSALRKLRRTIYINTTPQKIGQTLNPGAPILLISEYLSPQFPQFRSKAL